MDTQLTRKQIRAKEYRQENRELIAKRGHDYYIRNKQKSLEQSKRYRIKNRERVNEVSRNYYQANRDRLKQVQKAWRVKNPEKIRAYHAKHNKKLKEKFPDYYYFYHVKKRYGLSREQYDELLSKQNQCCAICREPLKRGRQCHVDHCHDTGKVRSILCGNCNTAIGLLRYSPGIAISVAQYLNMHCQSAS